MTISEVKKWAKGLGYHAVKGKDDGKYYWSKSDSNTVDSSGVAPSVSKLAKAIFNHITDNKWVDHQKEYNENKETKRISLTDYGT